MKDTFKIKNILAVDDEDFLLQSLRIAIKYTEYQLTTFALPESALQCLKEKQDKFDLIVSDYNMPTMNGLDFINEAKKIQSGISSILITGYGDKDLEVQTFRTGADDFINKPITLENLVNSIKKIEKKKKNQFKIFQTKLNELDDYYKKELKVKTNQLLHSDRLAILGLITVKIIHEINNIFAALKGNLELQNKTVMFLDNVITNKIISTADEFKVIPKIKILSSISSTVMQLSETMEKILKELKQFSGEDSPDFIMNTINLKDFFSDMIKFLITAQDKSIKFTINIENNMEIYSDKNKLRQIFMNLIINSVDALEKTANPCINISANNIEGNKILITVEDNGPGIDIKIIDEIWEPFFTTKPENKGTGLGLPIVKEIVDSLGGGILVVNGENCGVCFKIIIPDLKKILINGDK